MARRAFFSFEYAHDVSRAMVVRNSWVTQGKEAAGFIDAADFEKVKLGGDEAIKKWIRQQLKGTSVTVVLVGSHTCTRKYVRYEIEQSKIIGNGLLGIDVSKIKDLQGNTTERCGEIPEGYEFYLWNKHKGYENLGTYLPKCRNAGKPFQYWLFSKNLHESTEVKLLSPPNYFAV